MAEAQLFYSHKTDMIDWVTYSDTQQPSPDTYRSVNFLLNNKGFELNLQLLPQELWSEACPLRKLTAKYSYINEDSEYDVAVNSSNNRCRRNTRPMTTNWTNPKSRRKVTTRSEEHTSELQSLY